MSFPSFLWINIVLLLACGNATNTTESNSKNTAKNQTSQEIVSTRQVDTGSITGTVPSITSPTNTSTRKLFPKKFIKKAKGVNLGADYLVSEKIQLLAGKKVAIATNHTAILSNGKHLVDELMGTGIQVVKIFTPEHGFRGTADAGEKVGSSKDEKTGLPLVSLYGNNKKPSPEQLQNIDIVVFDIQDVGTRHYTYISTLAYIMEACAENNKEVIVLDRPNPNGMYVDGPMMQSTYTSFIGMHKVPIVHGMTIGEYAMMVNEEGWLKGGKKCKLSIVECTGYSHNMTWTETGLAWIPPSPNMGSDYAAFLYPILCWYEATCVSVGRGTNEAFTILGAPWHKDFPNLKGKNESYGLHWKNYDFTPVSIPGKAKTPPFQNIPCHGILFENKVEGKQLFLAGIALLQGFYQSHKAANNGQAFFTAGLEKWAGNKELQQQIIAGKSPEEIYNSWQKETDAFRVLRKKYLRYE